jgi:hypothetical protein
MLFKFPATSSRALGCCLFFAVGHSVDKHHFSSGIKRQNVLDCATIGAPGMFGCVPVP